MSLKIIEEEEAGPSSSSRLEQEENKLDSEIKQSKLLQVL